MYGAREIDGMRLGARMLISDRWHVDLNRCSKNSGTRSLTENGN